MNFIVKKSDIQGLGLFTAIDFQKGDKLYDYIGEQMSIKEFNKLYPKNDPNRYLNTYQMKRINRIIVAKNTDNLVNYINESNSPNCILKKRALYALVNINKGEELTLQYPKKYNRTWLDYP